ncbi:MAG: GNAT family N-acetyltransferase [Gaiellaceae bacterium]
MTSSLLRELREEDAEHVAALFREAFGGARRLDAHEVASWLRDPDLKREYLRVLEEEGHIVGYCDIAPRGEVLFIDLAAPGRWIELLDWAESQASSLGMTTASLFIPDAHELQDIALRRGYEKNRDSLTMEIAFDEPPQDGDFGELDLRTYRDEDHDVVIAALNEAFAEDPFWQTVTPERFKERFLGQHAFDPTLWYLAWDGAELAGFALDYPAFGADGDLGHVNWLGVRKPWRRRGLAEALLRRSFAALYARGKQRVVLGVDAQNVTGALRVYERVGMHVTRRFGTWQKGL